MPEFLNYKVSILNPILKLMVPLLFLVASVYLFRIWNRYQGEIGTVIRRLAIAGAVGFASNLFRFLADYYFKEFKWGESLFALAFALFCVFAVLPLLRFVRQVRSEARQIKEN